MSRPVPAWVLTLFVALLATGTDELVIAGVLPTVATDLDVSIGVAGQLVTVFAVAYALGAPLLAVLTDRFERRRVMVAGLLVFAVANAAAALAPGYTALLIARVVAALAAAAVTSAAFATAAAGAPEGRQGRYLSLVTAGMTVALFTGVPFGTWIAGAQGWRTTFWLLALLSVGVAVGIRVTAPVVPGGEPASLSTRLAPLRSLPVASTASPHRACSMTLTERPSVTRRSRCSPIGWPRSTRTSPRSSVIATRWPPGSPNCWCAETPNDTGIFRSCGRPLASSQR